MFSVVIPIYNHEAFLTEAVHSAVRDPLVTEILLVDDGSIDGSATLARTLAASYPDKVRDLTAVLPGNLDAPERYNQLVPQCANEWVAILNSDDVFTPGRFEAIQFELTSQSRGFDFVFGNILLIDANSNGCGHRRALREPQFEHQQLLNPGVCIDLIAPAEALAGENYILTTSNMVFTKSLFSEVGGFRAYRYCHDWDFAMRASILGRPRYLCAYLVNYRIHSTNTIAESGNAVAAEVQRMFAILAADFPTHFASTSVLEWLKTNQFLRKTI